MDKRIDPPGLASLRTRLSRRDLLGFAAKGAASGDGYAGTIKLGVHVG
jgi:hypothetical protein